MVSTFQPGSRFLRAAALCCALLIAGCSSELYSGLQEREANEMVRVLINSGIKAERVADGDGGFAVSVGRSDVAGALAELSRAGLPRENFTSLGEMFASDKLVSTPFEERARLMHAINQEMSNSLSQIAGVASARVFVNIPDQSPLNDDPVKPRASVFIYKNPGVDLQPLVPTIKNLIINSMEGMLYENVEVAIFETANPADERQSFGSGVSAAGSSFGTLILLGALLFGGLYLRSKLGAGRSNRARNVPSADQRSR